MSSVVHSPTSMRRMGEDPLLRPFLSSMFDPETYVKNIIRDGKSEECYTAITDCIEIINEEIQRYISQHKVIHFYCLLLFSLFMINQCL